MREAAVGSTERSGAREFGSWRNRGYNCSVRLVEANPREIAFGSRYLKDREFGILV